MHDTSAFTLARAARVLAERLVPAVVATRVPLEVTGWETGGEPVSFAEATAQPFSPVAVGQSWGSPWGTLWLRVTGQVPADWPAAGRIELAVDPGFSAAQAGFQAEGLIWDDRGRIVKGVEPRNNRLRLSEHPGDDIGFWVEMAANPDVAGTWDFAPTPLGDPATAGTAPLYRFAGAFLVLVDDQTYALERDVAILTDLAAGLPSESARRAGILRALDDALDELDPDDVTGSAAAVRARLTDVLAVPAPAVAHLVYATGHAHIDSAWLWPPRETVRKCARTFSNVLTLMDEYPDFVFAASSAQQYQWMRDHYPDLFARIRTRVAEGRFVPVGGMWVESDTNMPGGEAMARQFVLGKRFFAAEFDEDPPEVWLPDSFGYSGALPQIVRAAGSRYFLTQKTSWNDTNRLPHHSFAWEGIDGTRVLTHFPPVDTYNSDLGATDLARADRQNAERGVADLSLVPFGFGDGGGGPTREMIETGLRKKDLDGSGRLRFARPDEFFTALAAALPEPEVWSGELYLEFHRGTYTSQSRTKQGNRRCEHLLREAELWAATATVRTGADYPAEALRSAWETVLLNQFHDILPGSSIAWVHREAERTYARVAETLEGIIDLSLGALGLVADPAGPLAANASPFAVDGVPALGVAAPTHQRATVEPQAGGYRIVTGAFVATVDADGLLASMVDTATGRELLPDGHRGNELQLFRDTPNSWDAWDLDRSYQRMRLDSVRTDSVTADEQAVSVRRTVGSSPVEQRISATPDGSGLDIETRIDWHERQKLLKLAFPFDVHARESLSEIQFGHLRRPIHRNTSWDAARFETCAHRWVRVEEPDFGVTVANDRVYGHDITPLPKPAGGTAVLVRESLLRAPRFPDPDADQGEQVFRHSITVGSLSAGVQAGYRLNLPSRPVRGEAVAPLVELSSRSVTVEAVKLAEDGSGDVIVRLYESRGGRADARLTPGFPVERGWRTDLLERALDDQPADPLVLALRPFELVTLRLARDGGGNRTAAH